MNVSRGTWPFGASPLGKAGRQASGLSFSSYSSEWSGTGVAHPHAPLNNSPIRSFP
jgi:hypothetical protein